MIASKTLTTKVIEKRKETSDCATLRLGLDGHPFEYKPGMAVDVDPHQFPALAERIHEREVLHGRPEPNRGFSLSSHPLEVGFVEITVKEERSSNVPPLVTPYLVRELREGDPFSIIGPYGLYTVPDKLDPGIQCFIYVAAGSGVTPNRGIIRYCLAAGLRMKHILFYQNRAPEDVIYRDEWQELSRTRPDQFKAVFTFSRTHGQHLTLDLLKDQLRGFAEPSKGLGFVCGPNRSLQGRLGFVETFAGNRRKAQVGVLGQLGIPFERIKTELW